MKNELIDGLKSNIEIMIEMRDKHLNHKAAVVRAILQKRIEATQALIAKAEGV